jgi:feruloyl-CoA synthase
VDWLPWNHTFGGNHNFGMVVYNGGTLYIDDGKPTPALMGETLRNLREMSPTVYFNVPTGFEAIANAMKTDDGRLLRKTCCHACRCFSTPVRSLAQPVWDSLFESAEEAESGRAHRHDHRPGHDRVRPVWPVCDQPNVKAGDLGVPTPGMELKLVDMTARPRCATAAPTSPKATGVHPEETAAHLTTRASSAPVMRCKWIDETDVHQGLKFDGRIAEDFKLATGTFVSVGPLRAKIIAAGAPYIQDVVLTGINLKEVGAMVFPTPRVRP